MIYLYLLFCRENKEMKGKQAKVSVETAREVASDKTLRNKAERERYLFFFKCVFIHILFIIYS